MRIFIIGGGRIGQAMRHVLREKDVRVWDVDPDFCDDVDCVHELEHADMVLVCAPTSAHGVLAEQIKQHARTDCMVLSVAKGLGADGRTVPEILSDVLGFDRIGLLCGPMMAEEIIADKPSFAVCATHNALLGHEVKRVFADSSLHVDVLDDVHGVAWLSVLKNVYATLLGAMEALHAGCNMRGFLMTAVARESVLLVEHFGGRRDTWLSAAGMGDLVCTISSPHSRNRTYGESLVTGAEAIPGEGALALPFLKERLGDHFSEYRLLLALDDIMSDPSRVGHVFDHIMI